MLEAGTGGNIACLRGRMNNNDILDINILKTYANTPEDVEMFKDIFIQQTASDIASLHQACIQADHRNWVEINHKIKGAAAMAGAGVLRDLCARGQTLDNPSPAEREALFTEIRAAFETVRDLLKAM